MLAALLQNNNNARAEERPPMVKIDRGGGGPIWPRYDVIDVAAAIAAFPEVAGEDSVVRAARRTRWIGQALPLIKEAREKREAAAFLTGVAIGAADPGRTVAEEVAAASVDLAGDRIAQLVAIIDDVRANSAPSKVRQERAAASRGGAAKVGLFVGGLILGGLAVALIRRGRQRST